MAFSNPAIVFSYQGGTLKNHSHTTGAGDGGALTVGTSLLGPSAISSFLGYRRPNLTFGTTNTVQIESGIDGVSGDVAVLFPDNSYRITTSTTQTTMDIRTVASLTGTKKGGYFSGSPANNSWIPVYAVKSTDDSTFVAVGTTTLPMQANYAILNSTWGVNNWQYIGLARNGDTSGAASGILAFVQNGNITHFRNTANGNEGASSGIRFATTAGATSLTYTPTLGTGSTDIPNIVSMEWFTVLVHSGSGSTTIQDVSSTKVYAQAIGTGRYGAIMFLTTSDGMVASNGSSSTMDIFFTGFLDTALGSSLGSRL